jgi:hypothetical protein
MLWQAGSVLGVSNGDSKAFSSDAGRLVCRLNRFEREIFAAVSLSSGPGEGFFGGWCERDRRAEERSVRTAPPAAQRSEQPAEGRTLREVRPEGFNQAVGGEWCL